MPIRCRGQHPRTTCSHRRRQAHKYHFRTFKCAKYDIKRRYSLPTVLSVGTAKYRQHVGSDVLAMTFGNGKFLRYMVSAYRLTPPQTATTPYQNTLSNTFLQSSNTQKKRRLQAEKSVCDRLSFCNIPLVMMLPSELFCMLAATISITNRSIAADFFVVQLSKITTHFATMSNPSHAHMHTFQTICYRYNAACHTICLRFGIIK